MFAVDCIGVEAVCKMIANTGLKKFIIYRQNAAKGSTPIYEFTDGNQNAVTQKAFKDWSMNMNPNSGCVYEILLFNKEGESESETVIRKQDKIRFSFMLGTNTGFQNNNNHVDVETLVKNALNDYDQKRRIQDLEKRIKELEEGEEEEEETDIVEKISGIMQLMKKEKEGAQINGLGEPHVNTVQMGADAAEKTERLKIALGKIRAADEKYIEDIERLAKLATTNPKLFKQMLNKLRLIVTLP